jgi:acyl carrier protein
MNTESKQKLRTFLHSCLVERGDQDDFKDDESLFDSGRLDSLAVTMVIVYLEKEFGINFADDFFDVYVLDSVTSIDSFVTARSAH